MGNTAMIDETILNDESSQSNKIKLNNKTGLNFNGINKKLLSIGLIIIILFTTILIPIPETATAAEIATATTATSKNIKIDAFIKLLVQAIELQVDMTVEEPYINAAMMAGILQEGEFKDYTQAITRTDAAVLLNRADEKLHGDTVDADLLELVLEKRISDIKKISKDKREAVSKVYAKGIIKGYSNGNYIQNRKFNGSGKMSTATAKSFIKLVVNLKSRAQISPDGQLIRTTNLPKNADSYEYILECFPNKFYEKKFDYMLSDQYKAGERYPEDQICPADIRSSTFKNWFNEWDFSTEMDKYLYDWVDMTETYINYVFNVDYRTIGDDWIKGLASMYSNSNVDYEDYIKTYYLKQMKKNKVIIESSVISVEPSTLYYSFGYYMRVYVKYRITAKNIDVVQSQLIRGAYPNLKNLVSGEWRVGIFDIALEPNDGFNGDGSDFAIDLLTRFSDN